LQGLLLAFRTNNVLTRWNNARNAFQKVQSHCCNLQVLLPRAL
jgi:predicted membrane chloride channel (bestrophin family)